MKKTAYNRQKRVDLRKESQLPDYKRIYQDMIFMQYPDKSELCSFILNKEKLNPLDIIRLNNLITGIPGNEKSSENQKLKSYDEETIFKMLMFQKEHNLSNLRLAEHFRVSRNSIAKWKKYFLPTADHE
ncbi:helix-turn-helix domain-containing protein [Chryseobacterium sp. JJR-5R]|uniref:helix-turn-helix domain-containing protein n=1 Tax=Chryseobacterium sp. JJR-5R TaxID=3093923 RepID=UPI002A75F022|nr:helix-turn-helix domain-containing protein [Chryseobacterium sp. JJR-5R]WPO83120.1 helix-turn-helix domain-containing protein [Chryseobacterium sp. JJR-5R]